MKNNVRTSKWAVIILACMMYGIVCGLFLVQAEAYEMVYTIQIECHDDMVSALDHYYDLVNALDKEALNFLRIEKIGRVYCVRIGKFHEAERAKQFHRSVKPFMKSSTLLQAYVLNERIRKIFFQPRRMDEALHSSGSQPGNAAEPGEGISKGLSRSDHEMRGDMYVKEKRLLSAAEEYRLAMSDDPDDPELSWKLGELYYELRLTEDAFKLMQRAIGLSPGEVVTWRKKLGMRYYEHGRLDEAEEQFVAVLEINPETPSLNFYLGKIYLSRNRLDNAREQFIEALIMNPGSADSYYYLGKTYFQKKNFIMAWTATLTAERLGYDCEDFINELTKVSKRPKMPWNSNSKDLLIRQIVVQSRDRAEDIIFRLSQGENFENIVNDELGEFGKTLEYRDPSELGPKIADVSRRLEIFADPLIVETQTGFHVVQRIPSITVYANE